jgi:biotin carboxyl carrier protein
MLAEVDAARDGSAIWISCRGYAARFELPPRSSAAGGDELRAPMTGKVIELPFETGAAVLRGDTVAIIEAMKMEFRLEADRDGEIAEVSASVGDLVDLGQLLVRIK